MTTTGDSRGREDPFLVYASAAHHAPEDRPATRYAFDMWRPSRAAWKPPTRVPLRYYVWSAFHHARVFSNRDYGVLVVRDGERVVHTMGVFPGYFRFPFMGKKDLQLGDLWTDPSERGKGIATEAIRRAIALNGAESRRFWYLVASSNRASIRAAERAGLVCVGGASRESRWGVALLGWFALRRSGG